MQYSSVLQVKVNTVKDHGDSTRGPMEEYNGCGSMTERVPPRKYNMKNGRWKW